MSAQAPNPRSRVQRFTRAAKIVAIFLALFAAAAVLHPPKYADGSQQSQDATLAECLRYLRAQLFAYSLDHHGVPPGFPGNDITQPPDSENFAAQMTQYTDSAGRYSPRPTDDRNKGPYLTAIPANPITLHAGLMVVTSDKSARADGSKPYGWIYNPLTRQISPNVAGADSKGVSYASY